MIFDILDPSGSLDVKLGMRRGHLRRVLGTAREFRRTPTSPMSEQFAGTGVMATYDARSRVTVLEFGRPADVRLSGLSVLGLPVELAIEHLREKMRLEVAIEDDVVVVGSWRMALYSPEGTVEGLLLGE